jgi:MinD superfamily P-loop ATPase
MKIAIASGKGGTGKTLISTNLTKYLSEKRSVILADIDVEEPNTNLFIKGKPINTTKQFRMVPQWYKDKCILCGECQANCKFNAIMQMIDVINVFEELCHGCYACSGLCPTTALPMVEYPTGETVEYQSDSLVLIESRLNIGEEQAVPLINKTHKIVDEKYENREIKIYDSPPGTSCPVIAATEDVDFVILVTEPTAFGLNDLKLAVETMRFLDKEFAVIINRYGMGNDDVEKYCQQENIDLIAKIHFDVEIAKYYSKGELIYNKLDSFKNSLKEIENYLNRIIKN